LAVHRACAVLLAGSGCFGLRRVRVGAVAGTHHASRLLEYQPDVPDGAGVQQASRGLHTLPDTRGRLRGDSRSAWSTQGCRSQRRGPGLPALPPRHRGPARAERSSTVSLPGNAVIWQGIAAVLAAVLAAVSGTAAVKAFREQDVQAKDIKGWLTGGDSYPYLEPFAFLEGVAYLVRHAGSTYPLYDVQVRVQDLDRGPRLPDGSVLPTQFYPVGTLTGNTDKFPVGGDLRRENPPPDSREVRRFRIELPARNGLVLQEVTMTAVNGRWHTTSRPIRKNIANQGWVDLQPANFHEAQEQTPREPKGK